MSMEGVPRIDDRAKRTRELLASFYSPDPSAMSAAAAAATAAVNPSPKTSSLESINFPRFDPEVYMNVLVQGSNLEGLLRRHVEMAAEIKNLDTDLQMLVYENYNKFISATDTIKRMKNNITCMENSMEQLLEKIVTVQSRSVGINTSLFEKREHIERLHRTRNLLRKVQFIYDLPTRLRKCVKSEAYADAVRFFTGAKPIFEAYGDSSFHECKKASEEVMELVIQNLQAKLYSDTEPIDARAEAVVLLRQLNFPVDRLKAKLFEKLEDFLLKFRNDRMKGSEIAADSEPSATSQSDEETIKEFSKAVRAYRIIFPDSEKRLIELSHDLFSKCYKSLHCYINNHISSSDLLTMLRVIAADIAVMDEVLPEAAFPALSLEIGSETIRKYILTRFSQLLLEVSDSLLRTQSMKKEGLEESPLQLALESSKKVVMQGSMDLLLDFRHLLDNPIESFSKLRDWTVDWVQEGFQDFFQKLERHFLSLCGRCNSKSLDSKVVDSVQVDKVQTGLVLVLAQLSVFIEQNAIPRITEEIAASFSGGGVRGYEYGPAFVPGEICRLFRSAGEKFLHFYINMKTQRLSLLLKKRLTTPNWIKHKEPREVHMFVDILIQEIENIGIEVRQILLRGLVQRHHHSDSTGSNSSSRSNPTREDKFSRSNTQRARSQLLESHLAKLFEQKMEIFTKVEYTQESVISTIVKLSLKSLQEFVRLQTFNRSGYQQIQLDIEYLKNPLKDFTDDEAVIDFLLQEVTHAAHDRCMDPIPLEPAILDKLIQVKQAKTREH